MIASGQGASIGYDQLTSQDYYFDTYAHINKHEEMLKDTMRTNTFKNAIYHNKHLIKWFLMSAVEQGFFLCLLPRQEPRWS